VAILYHISCLAKGLNCYSYLTAVTAKTLQRLRVNSTVLPQTTFSKVGWLFLGLITQAPLKIIPKGSDTFARAKKIIFLCPVALNKL